MVSILPLTLAKASARKGGTRLVGPIDLKLGAEGFTMVIGPNGAGKTTLLRLMHGLERCAVGNVNWAVAAEEAHRHQAFVFQTPVMMRRRVLDSLAFPLILRGASKKDAQDKAAEIAARFGLAQLAEHWAPQLSGGEKQKLSLARALVTEPQVLFLDEPCASLDGRATREIEAILQAARAQGTRIIMSTHDMGQARRLAEDVIFMHKGRICEHSDASGFFSAPATARARRFLAGDIVE